MKNASGSSVGERGQITIEKSIRDRLDVKPRDIAIQAVVDGRLVVTFVRIPEPHMRSVAGILGPPPRLPIGEIDYEKAAAEGAAEDYLASLPGSDPSRTR